MPVVRTAARKAIAILELVKFSHTVFALPFALIACLVAANGIPAWRPLGWILVAMAGARTSAMAWNRIVDREIDRHNPRTENRPLQTGRVALWEAVLLWLAASALFVFAAWRLNPLAFALSLPVLLVLWFYSTTKRFTPLSHLFLGLALGCAPVGAWIALRGEINLPPVVLGLAVLFWVAGFDIIYALQDEALDRKMGLHSLVTALGAHGALLVSRLFHLVCIALLVGFGMLAGLGGFYYFGVFAVAVALVWEQNLVRPPDLSRVNVAFFTANGIVGLSLLIFTALDVLR